MAAAYEYRLIQVGVDFSPASREALARAVHLARQLDAELEIVHVVERLQATLPFVRRSRLAVAELQRELIAEARERVQTLVPKRAGRKVRARVLAGKPSEALLSHAVKVGADLLVLANLGHSTVQEVFVGSTAEQCLRRARIPVMLVPKSPPGARSRRRRRTRQPRAGKA